MQPRRLLALITTLAGGALAGGALACGGADVEPKSGTWTYLGSNIVSNTCGDSFPTDPVGSFTITVTDGGKFTVNAEDGADAFTCTYDGGKFECPNRVSETIEDADLMAAVTVHVGIAGDLDSSTELSGVQDVDVDCVGSGCALVQTAINVPQFPCAYSYSFNAKTE